MVVLSLLAVFAMIAVTFVIIANLGEGEAKQAAKMETEGDAPSDLTDRAIYDLLRGPAPIGSGGVRSALYGHDLLQDLYGNDGFTGTISRVQPTPNTQQQFVDIAIPNNPPMTSLSQINNYYNGCVLTFTSGLARSVSVRIVGYRWDAGATRGIFTTMAPQSDTVGSALPSGGDLVVVNGRPFNGTGAGLNRGAAVDEPMLGLNEPFGINPQGPDGAFGEVGIDDDRNGTVDDATEVGLGPPGDDVFIPSLALLPNRTALTAIPLAYSQGGLDESYDAADYQNMALAYLPVDADDIPANSGRPELIPSFHRPALVNYWYAKILDETQADALFDETDFWSGAPIRARYLGILNPREAVNQMIISDVQAEKIASLKRKFILRPLRDYHPNFTGSNPSTTADFTPFETAGPWDVDNDGDAVRDSIWIDPGYPVQRTRDGRLYKPLFAYLVVDLDGRLNLNAHGSPFDERVKANAGMTPVGTDVNDPVSQTIADGSISTDQLPRGQGYGTPEISLGSILNSAHYTDLRLSRYGGDTRPGRQVGLDLQARIKHSDVPDKNDGTDTTPMRRKAFSNLPDLHGTYGVGLDARGLPVNESNSAAQLRVDSPYEFNLSRKGTRDTNSGDAPFTVYEMEELLRPYDADSVVLDNRLGPLHSSSLSNPRLARLLTTESWSLPVPATTTTRELRDDTGLSNPRTILDILKARILLSIPGATDAQVNEVLYNTSNTHDGGLVSHDLKMGLRMDVNRAFGNGQDDNNNDVVDEPFEGDISNPRNEYLWSSVFGTSAKFTPLAVNNDGMIDDTDYELQRQLYARHLYVLMMALTDAGYSLPADPSAAGSTLTLTQRKARRIAQWAINVVDFRDPDAIMTPFEYDENPFDGWQVDGDLASDESASGVPSGVVWGCERPELLITESLAWHDRRTEDLSTPSNLTTTTGNPDPDFDQRLLPRSGFFVELYNPWSSESVNPGEFYYDRANSVRRPGVRLNQTSTSGNSPVWRLLIVKEASKSLDPDNNDPTIHFPASPTDVERSVYFTNPGTGITDGGVPFHTSMDVAPLIPGRYAVVGSSGEDFGGNPTSFLGRRTDAVEGGNLNKATTRRIELSPNVLTDVHQVNVFDNGTTDPTTPDIQPAIAIAIDQPRSLSISDPPTDVGYDPTTPQPTGEVWDPTAADNEGAFNPPIDRPLDLARSTANPEWDALQKEGTTENFRVVHLQRLANPLLDWNPEPRLPDGTANPDHDSTIQVNPYRTIDSMSVDLTAFNGVVNDSTDTNVDESGHTHLETLQRGDQDTASPPSRNIWLTEPENAPFTADSAPEGVTVGPHHLGFELQHTLGYLNRQYQPALDSTTAPAHALDSPPYRYLAGFPDTTTPNDSVFPWLTWNNRPFVSQYELMLVPASSSSRLFYEFSIEPNPASPDPYESDPSSGAAHENYRAPFNHLLNFFQTARTPDMAGIDTASHHYRLFDYTYVPSRFVGMETLLNPSVFGNTSVAETESFRPPFNKVSNYREPGRVNLNTMVGQQVWEGIMQGGSSARHEGPVWNDLVDSRRGYGTSGETPLTLNPDSPTFFANPFRSAGAGELVPTAELMRSDVETTLLRSSEIGNVVNPPSPAPPNGDPLFDGETTATSYNNSDRNPYFRYQPMTRLGNLVTTQSNVYAVWVTVGFFEVEAAPSATSLGMSATEWNQVYPDGYRLAKELGSDTGEVKRHRSFYIIDRSIPVGFEPGQNHNVDKAILLRRFLE